MSKKISRSKARHAVVVLGMHRSGTSALAGVLARLGCDLPETLMPANEFNPKGFYESIKSYNMNDAILASGGSGWDDWQSFNPGWFESPRMEEYLDRGAEVLKEEYGTSRLFVLKDPRICRLLPFWTRLFEQQKIHPVYVLIHRSPMEVARSLETREGWPLATGLLLWLRHVLEAERGSRGAEARCFTSYDRLLNGWGGVVNGIQERTGLSFPRFSDSARAEIEDFLNGGLRHSVETLDGNPIVSKWVRITFEILEHWAEEGETEDGYAALDEVRAEFDAAAPMFSQLIHTMRARNAKDASALEETNVLRDAEQRHAAKKYDELLTVKTALQSEVEALRTEAGNNSVLQAEIDTLQKKNEAQTAELARRQEDLDGLYKQRLETERVNAQLTARIEDGTHRLQELQQKLEEVEQDFWQTKSALAQRSLEAEDVGRQSQENAARVEELESLLGTLRVRQAELESERDQVRKSSRMMRVKLREEFEAELSGVLATQRKFADERSAKLQEEVQKLQSELEAARRLEQHREEEMQRLSTDRDSSIAEREALAELLSQQQARNTELEHVAAAYVNSTSWKITAPLRRVVLALRGQA